MMTIFQPDIYYAPEYVELFEKSDQGKAIVFRYTDNVDEVSYAFILRPIEADGFPEGYHDIISPYGYGGPAVFLSHNKGDAISVLKGFEREFSVFCKDHKVVSEFVRFHPLLENVEYCREYYQAEFNRQTVAVNLSLNDLSHESFESRCRNSIRKAEAMGVYVEYDSTGNTLDEFQRIYMLTMQKNMANDYYFFSPNFFRETMDRLGDRIVILNAIYQGEIVGASMFMLGDRFMHYHFSATNPSHYKLACNNLILATAAEYGKKIGLSFLHLGGGFTSSPEDTLLKFKKSFSQTGLLEFWIGKRIHDDATYQKLVEIVVKNKNIQNTSYFPLYRAS